MGDRAVVTFHDGAEPEHRRFSPCVYLHWGGSDVRQLLEKALPRLRQEDEAYSAARFCGVCHEETSGNTGVGLFDAPEDEAEARSPSFSHGDAGVFLVNVNTWLVEAVNGYGFANEEEDGDDEVTTLQLDASKVSR